MKGYVTNLAACPDRTLVTAEFVIGAYHRLHTRRVIPGPEPSQGFCIFREFRRREGAGYLLRASEGTRWVIATLATSSAAVKTS
jgi:hypothetical protein